MNVSRIVVDLNNATRAIELVAAPTALDSIKLILITSVTLSSVGAMFFPGVVGGGTNILSCVGFASSGNGGRFCVEI